MELFEAVMRALPEACMACDLEFKPTWWNEVFTAVSGYSDEEIASMKLADFFAPETVEVLLSSIRKVLKQETIKFDTVVLRKDGRRTPSEISARVIRDADNRPVGICGIGRDISERRRVEAALLESREHLEATLNALPDLLFEVDAEGRILDFRAGSEGVLLMKPGEFLGRTVDEVMPREAASIIMTTIQRAAKTGMHRGTMYALELPTGIHWFELSVASKGAPGATGGHCIALIRDITDRHRAARALREERNFISAVLDTAGALVVVLDQTGGIVRFNRACESTTGYSFAEVKGRKVWELFLVPEEEVTVRAVFDELEAGIFPNTFENYWLTRGGERRRIAWSNTALTDDAGAVRHVVSTGIDITEQKVAQEALRSSEEKYRAIFENAREGIIATTPEGTIIDVNGGAARILGYESPDELIGRSIASLYMFPEQRETVVGALARNRSPESLELTLKRKDGSAVYVLVSMALERDEQGRPVRHEGIFMDITERKLMEDELQRINVELEGYAHTVSHDLKGPLSAMSVAHETLDDFLKKPQTETVREDIEELMWIIGSNLKKSVLLIEDLLALAEAGKGPGELTRVDVADVVDWVRQEREPDIREKGIALKVAPDLGEVTADLVHIYELFSNLISNAIQHNDRQGLEIEVSRLEGNGVGRHRYMVRDNGRGIPPDMAGQIFKPFFKVDSGGTGIGLAIVQKIVETYNGTIRAYNDGGACFEFEVEDREEAPD